MASDFPAGEHPASEPERRRGEHDHCGDSEAACAWPSRNARDDTLPRRASGVERREQRRRGCGALVRSLGEALHDDGLEYVWYHGLLCAERWRRLRELRHDHRLHCRARREGMLARQELPRHYPQA